MKVKNKITLLAIVLTINVLLLTFSSTAQGVGINATGVTPDPSALLDLKATNKGFLITRVDTANITSPAFGLMTLAPRDSCLYMYSGLNWISLGGVGSNCPCASPEPSPPPSFPCNGTIIPVIEVTSVTGRVWMDRNLGASQVATRFDDEDAYGDLYQWGRCSDGHEKRNSGTTTTISTTDTPGHGSFITNSSSPYDWRSTQNDNLWQGTSGINNPCPTGYRLPTETEWSTELQNWSNENDAFNSALKLSVAGGRNRGSGWLNNHGVYGYYWSSTVSGALAKYSFFGNSNASITSNGRATGCSVRCIKN